ncbi:hypothetical protein [Streptomyces spectabilis]|uniref:Uncharacterized protein n=1 Tax=Streptomyces spectabilis TaxID=68270 RepID=A0A5P2X7Y8_STRST|nr:hypothetical protein [Streptomyces spectabilis]MBB5108262.1 hypothetical protein [Streptomyces spectabilis]MCI3901023.1 hypothetical protein [Streptomyces spectabilis]QEV58522.1 hypothetical protein CP982_07210 [Streptomyces spectabilis]GGV45527.1 hypothetical protein GCM10010245_71230 [Streptomyces spectabilis]
MTEPYDPLSDLIARAEKRPDGVSQLKDVARLALSWHRPVLTWVTGGIRKDPVTGEDLWRAATVCACGIGEFPCGHRQQLTAILGVVEEYQP